MIECETILTVQKSEKMVTTKDAEDFLLMFYCNIGEKIKAIKNRTKKTKGVRKHPKNHFEAYGYRIRCRGQDESEEEILSKITSMAAQFKMRQT